MSHYGSGLAQDFDQLHLHHDRGLRSQDPAPAPYRSTPGSYRPGYGEDDLPPPPPLSTGTYLDDQQYPPPPPLSERGYGYRDDYPPPPPSSGLTQVYDYKNDRPVSSKTSSSYTSKSDHGRAEYKSQSEYITQPGFQKTVQKSSYVSHSSDPRDILFPSESSSQFKPGFLDMTPSSIEKPRSPYTIRNVDISEPAYPPPDNTYANISSVSSQKSNYSNVYNPPPSQSHQFEPVQSTSTNYRTNSPPGIPIPIQYERPIPGPQVPTTNEPVQVKLTPAPVSHPAARPVGKEAEVDALTNLLLQNMESAGDPEYFGMCAKCNTKVMGEVNGCTALDQVYHISCFTCCNCAITLQGKSFYSMENKPYCEKCYMNTLEKCSVCSKPVTDRLLRATGKPYHPACFVCVVCGKSLDGIPFTVDATNQIHCIEDFHKKFAPRCCVCNRPIMPDKGGQETVRIVALDRSFHVDCYRCEDCRTQLSSEAEGRGCYPLDDHILCKSCNAKRIQAMTTKISTEL